MKPQLVIFAVVFLAVFSIIGIGSAPPEPMSLVFSEFDYNFYTDIPITDTGGYRAGFDTGYEVIAVDVTGLNVSTAFGQEMTLIDENEDIRTFDIWSNTTTTARLIIQVNQTDWDNDNLDWELYFNNTTAISNTYVNEVTGVDSGASLSATTNNYTALISETASYYDGDIYSLIDWNSHQWTLNAVGLTGMNFVGGFTTTGVTCWLNGEGYLYANISCQNTVTRSNFTFYPKYYETMGTKTDAVSYQQNTYQPHGAIDSTGDKHFFSPNDAEVEEFTCTYPGADKIVYNTYDETWGATFDSDDTDDGSDTIGYFFNSSIVGWDASRAFSDDNGVGRCLLLTGFDGTSKYGAGVYSHTRTKIFSANASLGTDESHYQPVRNYSLAWDNPATASQGTIYATAEPTAPIVDIILPENTSYYTGGGFWRNVTIGNGAIIGNASWCGVSVNGAGNATMAWDHDYDWFYWVSNPSASYRDIYCCNSTADFGAAMNCSASVNYTIEDMTSLYAVELPINDTTFASTDYVTVLSQNFNTTTSEVFGLMSSFNVQKLTGGGTSIITARIKVDGDVYIEEDVRTVVNNNQQGSTGIRALYLNLTEGTHNITIDFKRTGNGNIELSNQDYVLGKFNTTAGYLVRGALVNLTYSYSSIIWSEGYNWTMTKAIDSPSYYGGKFSVTSTGHDHIWLNYTNWNTSESSRNTIRHITGATDIGGVGIVWLDENNTDTHNITMGSKTLNGETITVEGALFNFDLRDSDNNLVNNFQVNNTTITETDPMIIIGNSYQLIDEKDITMYAGTGFFISTSLSFNSSSGSQTAGFKINVTNADCESNKERYLVDNDDTGNAFMYVICDGLTVGNTYTISLWGTAGIGVPTTETLQILSTTLTGLEITNYTLNETGSAPVISIQEPDSVEITNNIWFNVTTNQDNTDWCGFSLDGASNYTMTNTTGNWNNYTLNITDGIHYVHFYCNNTDSLMGETDDWYFFIGDAGDYPLEVIPFITAIIAFLLLWVSRKIESNDALKILYFGLSIIFIIITLFTNIVLIDIAGYNDLTTIYQSGLIAIILISVFMLMRLLLNFSARTLNALDGDDND